MIIKPKPALLNKIIYSVLALGVAVSLLTRFFLNLDGAYVYFITALIVLSGIIFGFKLNRNEVHAIVVNNDLVDFLFLNKSFYKRKDLEVKRSEIKTVAQNNQLHLFKDDQLFAIVRKDTVTSKEWEELNTFFR